MSAEQKQSKSEDTDDSQNDGSNGRKSPLPPVFWSVIHHQNLHNYLPIAQQRQDILKSPGDAEENLNIIERDDSRSSATGYGSIPPSTSSPIKLPPVGDKKSNHWDRIREIVKTNELLIRYTQDDDADEACENQRWSDLSNESYELTLRECLFLFIALLAFGVLAYSFIFERWSIIDSLYFTVVMLSTTGYGDLSPSNPGGKLFASVFALAGIVLLGLVLGVAGSQLIEAEIIYSQKVKSEATKALEKAFRKGSPQRLDKGDIIVNDMQLTDKSLIERNYSSASMESIQSQESCSAFDSRRHVEKGVEHQVFISKVLRQLPGFVPLVIGGIIMAVLEHWKWYDVIYYCVATATVRLSDVDGSE